MNSSTKSVESYFWSDEENRASVFRWSRLGVLLENGVARSVYVVPLAGYVILYSDFFNRIFSFSILSSWGFLTFFQRVSMLYFGSCLLLFSYVLYLVFSPTLLRGQATPQAFVNTICASHDSITMRFIMRETLKFLDRAIKHESEYGQKRLKEFSDEIREFVINKKRYDTEFHNPFPSFLHFYYNYQNRARPFWRIAIFVCAIFSYALLALPAIDLFARVVAKSIQHWMVFV